MKRLQTQSGQLLCIILIIQVIFCPAFSVKIRYGLKLISNDNTELMRHFINKSKRSIHIKHLPKGPFTPSVCLCVCEDARELSSSKWRLGVVPIMKRII